MLKENSPPVNLDQYLEGREHKYMTYETASRMYGIPYWAFVSLAKEAKATWKLRKTAIVDIAVLDKYLEEQCMIEKDEDVVYGKEKINMANRRKEVENLEGLVKSKKKKYVRYAEGAEMFSLCMHTFQQIAKDAGAIRRVWNSTELNCTRKFRNIIKSFLVVQRISDQICLEHGISVIEPKPYCEREKYTDYEKRKTIRSEICKDIESALGKNPKNFEEMIFLLEEDYEIKRGKNIALRGKNQKRFIRMSSLGEGFSEKDLREVIENPRRQDYKKKEFDLLIDIQEKLDIVKSFMKNIEKN